MNTVFLMNLASDTCKSSAFKKSKFNNQFQNLQMEAFNVMTDKNIKHEAGTKY